MILKESLESIIYSVYPRLQVNDTFIPQHDRAPQTASDSLEQGFSSIAFLKGSELVLFCLHTQTCRRRLCLYKAQAFLYWAGVNIVQLIRILNVVYFPYLGDLKTHLTNLNDNCLCRSSHFSVSCDLDRVTGERIERLVIDIPRLYR